MAEPKKARVLANLSGPTTGALLALQMEDQEHGPLVGGKYIIINSGLLNSEGKASKRAYSLFGVDSSKGIFFIAAETVATGVVSSYLRQLQSSDSITFSGPWGKFHWPEAAHEKMIVAAAFGSGITAILGYLKSVPQDCVIKLFWYESRAESLVGENIIHETLGSHAHSFLRSTMHHDSLANLDFTTMSQARFIAAGEGESVDRWFHFIREHGIPDDRLQSDIFYRVKLS